MHGTFYLAYFGFIHPGNIDIDGTRTVLRLVWPFDGIVQN